jgi:Ca2+-binding EF-hand superfamily protein
MEGLNIFRLYDADGNGLIARDELIAIFKDLDPVHWAEQRVDSLLAEVDINGDGN